MKVFKSALSLVTVASVLLAETAAYADVARVSCRAANGTGFTAEIDAARKSIIVHGSAIETYVDGNVAPAQISKANGGCREFVEITDEAYSFGYRCNNDWVYEARIDRYSGAFVREINGGNWGRANCTRLANQPQL